MDINPKIPTLKKYPGALAHRHGYVPIRYDNDLLLTKRYDGRNRLYQGALIMTHRDRETGLSGRRKAAGDAVHRQGFSTPSDGLVSRPERRLPASFG
jgi:hypothetical protein